MLFDSHTHLNFEEFTDEKRSEIANEIKKSNLKYIIDAGDCYESSLQAVKDANKYDFCYAAVGIHPEHTVNCNDEILNMIEKLANNKKVKAIGEIGLDFHYGKDYKKEQIYWFRKQIRLANKLAMPIMIHTRDADGLTMDILKEEEAFSEKRKKLFPKRKDANGIFVPDARVQLHCYSGSAEMAMQYVKLGATISIGGPVTFKNGKKTVEVVKKVPAEFLLSETDAPFLTPEPFRGRENKPQYVEYIVRRIALIKGIEYEKLEQILFENGKRFFGIED